MPNKKSDSTAKVLETCSVGHSISRRWTKKIKAHAKKFFYPNHDYYGLIRRLSEGEQYRLLMYHQPTRSEEEAFYEEKLLSPNNFSGENFKIPSKTSSDISSRLLILKNNTALNFTKSLAAKKCIVETPKELFPEDVIVFIQFGKSRRQTNHCRILKKKLTESPRHAAVKLIELYFNDQDYKKDLDQVTLETKNSLQTAQKVRVFISAHCNAGSSSLSGYETEGEEGATPALHYKGSWKTKTLAHLFKAIGIQKSSHLFIDIYACYAGESRNMKASFITRLAETLKKRGYKHFTVEGNKHEVWAFFKPTSASLKDVQENIASVTIGGTEDQPTYSLRG